MNASAMQQRVRRSAATITGTPVATSIAVASQPTTTVEDANFTVTVQVKDQFGNNFSNTASITVAKLSGTGTLTGTSPRSAVAGLATFSDLQMDTSGASVILRFSSTGLGTCDTTTITVTAAGAITQFDNSTESGHNDSAAIWYEDHNTPCASGPSYMELNGDDAVSTYGGFATPTALPHTRGNYGTIFNTTPYPAPVIDLSAFAIFSPYGASHGIQPATGADFITEHNWSRGVTEFYQRWYQLWPSGYGFGAEKVWDFNPPNNAGNGGIIWGNVHINLGGPQSPTGSLAWQGTGGASYTGLATINSGRVYCIQVYGRRTGSGANGLLKMWCDDLGATGSSVPGSPTLVLNRSDYSWIPATGSPTQFGSNWIESWANAGSSGGPSWYTNIATREASDGGVSPIPFRAA